MQQSTVSPEGQATQSTKDIFRYSGYVHAGPGAEECEDALNGACGSPHHFHAYLRLPNQLQHQDIREKALAAKARRIRVLRDPEADASAVLEGDLYEIERTGDTDAIVEELVQKNWWRDHMTAMNDIEDTEEFSTMPKDRERYAELEAMPEEKRPAEEWKDLVHRMTEFGDKVEERRREIQQPQRDALSGKSMGDLITILRDDRVNAEASAIFMQTYNKWEWYVGTYRVPKATEEQVEAIKRGEQGPKATERYWSTIAQMEESEPEVIEAVSKGFTELERTLQGSSGKALS